MMTYSDFIFDKTDRGREEIATRKYGLASRLRQLLVMIDGKKSQNELLAKVSGLGLDDKSIVELIDNNFIQQINIPEVVVEPEAMQLSNAAGAAKIEVPLDAAGNPIKAVLTDFERIVNLKHFFNETIKGVIGLRGFSLQLKVEKAGTVEEMRALREPYFQAALKAKGNEMALSLLSRLDALLND